MVKKSPNKRLSRKQHIQAELEAARDVGIQFSGAIPVGKNFRTSHIYSRANPHQDDRLNAAHIARANDQDHLKFTYLDRGIGNRLSEQLLSTGDAELAVAAAKLDASTLSPEGARALLEKMTQSQGLFTQTKKTTAQTEALQRKLSSRVFKGVKFKDTKGKYGGGQG